jgi:hypothetical protein
MDAVLRHVRGFMRVSTEDAVGTVMARVHERSRGDLRRHAQPACVEAVDQACDGLAFRVEFLQLQIEGCSEAAQRHAVHLESVELVAMDGDVFQTSIVPDVSLVNPHADQVRHDIGQSVVVIAFDPHDFHITLWIGELADAS